MYMMIEKYFSDPILTSKFSCVIINLNCSLFTFHLVFLLLTLSFHLRCYLCIPVNVFYKGIFRSAKAIDPIFIIFLIIQQPKPHIIQPGTQLPSISLQTFVMNYLRSLSLSDRLFPLSPQILLLVLFLLACKLYTCHTQHLLRVILKKQ